MKKIIICILFNVICLSVFAQKRESILINQDIKTDTTVITIEPAKARYQPHAVGIEASTGYGFGPMMDLPLGFDASIRYTWNIIPYIGWEVIKFKFSFNDGLEQTGYINALSGVRFSTPRFGRSKASYVYTAFRFGAAYYNDYDYYGYNYYGYNDYYYYDRFGFTWECDMVGIHFRHFFMNFKYSYLNAKHYIGYSLGVDIGKLKEIKKRKSTD